MVGISYYWWLIINYVTASRKIGHDEGVINLSNSTSQVSFSVLTSKPGVALQYQCMIAMHEPVNYILTAFMVSYRYGFTVLYK